MIKFQYKDKDDWTDVNGIVTDWTNYAIKYKDDRVQPSFLAPEIVQGLWNGKESDVQHVRHDYFYCELTVKESEKKSISQMKSCSDIQIIDFEMNDSGTVINQTYTLDTTKSDYIEIEEIEANIGNTSGAKYSIKFRTNRTVINKGLPVDNTNYIQFGSGKIIANVGDLIYTDSVKVSRLDDEYVLFSTTDGVEKRQLVNNTWIARGNKLAIDVGAVEAVGLSENRIAAIDTGGNLGTYDFDGTNWSLTGSTLSISGIESYPSIAFITSTRIAIASEDLGTIQTYDFSGSAWSATGSSFSLGTVTYPKITYYTNVLTETIAYVDTTNDELRLYDFSGSAWSLSTIVAGSLSITINGTPAISRIDGGNIAYIDDDQDYRYYEFDPTSFSLLTTKSTNSVTSTTICESTSSRVTIVENDYIRDYEYDFIKYYSDYDILDYNKNTDPVIIEWSDGSDKLAQNINKDGYEYLQYIESSSYDEFIEQLKSVDTVVINGVSLYEYEYEPTLIGEGLYKIIIRAIIHPVTVNSFDLSENQTNHLEFTLSTSISYDFYTDFDVEQISEAADKSEAASQTGVNITTKAISKEVKQFKIYLNETNAFNLKEQAELFNPSWTCKLNSATVYEITNSDNIEPNKIGVDLYEVIVNCLTATTTN